MQAIAFFYETHPFWAWMAAAAVLLVAEVATGSGYLLWPAAAAGVVAVVGVFRPLGLPAEVTLFAVLTILSTFLARKYLPRRAGQRGPDINDRAGRLVGRFGEAVGAFVDGQGRAFVDGAEWIAEIDPASEPLAPGTRVEVVDVLGGGRLKVRAA
jgi:membrane protein implicated in regulation of membrane protease activity